MCPYPLSLLGGTFIVQARAALAAIKAVSKDALDELRTTLAPRKGNEDAPRAPAPGLDRLDELVAATRAAGIPVHGADRR